MVLRRHFKSLDILMYMNTWTLRDWALTQYWLLSRPGHRISGMHVLFVAAPSRAYIDPDAVSPSRSEYVRYTYKLPTPNTPTLKDTMHTYTYIYIFIYLSIYLSIYVCVYACVYLYINLVKLLYLWPWLLPVARIRPFHQGVKTTKL